MPKKLVSLQSVGPSIPAWGYQNHPGKETLSPAPFLINFYWRHPCMKKVETITQ